MSIDGLMALVARSVREVADREQVALPDELGPETALFGKGGVFDSLGLVSLVLAVEEALRDEHGVSVSLADERAMSQSRSPFRTIGALAEYVNGLLEQPRADAR